LSTGCGHASGRDSKRLPKNGGSLSAVSGLSPISLPSFVSDILLVPAAGNYIVGLEKNYAKDRTNDRTRCISLLAGLGRVAAAVLLAHDVVKRFLISRIVR
jgi:hypothetical protein